MRIERYDFHHLPLTISGNTTVARVTGYVIWRLKDNGGSISLDHIHEVHLRGDLHEVVWCDITSESIGPAIKEALERAAKNLSNHPDGITSFPLGDQAELPVNLRREPLDNAAPEGAQHTAD